jgi:hypothetical protein
MIKKEIIEKACNKDNVFAVVGASNNPSKYGYRIYSDLKSDGYKVYPVNPREESVQGDKAYPDIKSLPEKPDVVDIVTPPGVTEQVVKEAVEQGVGIVWMQPGAQSDAAIKYANDHGLLIVHDSCIMVERRYY